MSGCYNHYKRKDGNLEVGTYHGEDRNYQDRSWELKWVKVTEEKMGTNIRGGKN